MREGFVVEERDGSLALVALNDPQRRNALSLAMFDALDAALGRAGGEEAVAVVLLYGRGRAFCSGFDLAAAAQQPALLGPFIMRLSATLRALRRMRPVVVAAVQGAAVAGGCGLLTACDLAVVAPDAAIGYPVHRLGVSPAVSMPTLAQKIGAGAARRLQVGGELIDGRAAVAIGLASHLAHSAETVLDEARRLCERIAGNAHHALRATKAWLNELDGSLEDGRFEAPARDTAAAAGGEEAARLLREAWAEKRPNQKGSPV